MQNDKIIIRLPNWIGDTLMTYPLLLALQKSGVDFTCLGHPWAKDLFSGTDFNIVTNSEIKNIKWCYRFYRKNNFKEAILCTNTLSSVIPMRLSGLKPFSYHPLSGNRLNYNNSLHTVENYFELGSAFVRDNLSLDMFKDKIPVASNQINIAEQIIKDKIKSDYIVICPYATNLHKRKNKEWPYWKEFCEKYDDNCKIVALVSSSDVERCRDDFEEVIVLSCSLSVTGYLMKRAKYVLANDSGAMHIAAFFGANVVGLFGATEINKTRPWHGKYLTGIDNAFIKADDLLRKIKDIVSL